MRIKGYRINAALFSGFSPKGFSADNEPPEPPPSSGGSIELSRPWGRAAARFPTKGARMLSGSGCDRWEHQEQPKERPRVRSSAEPKKDEDAKRREFKVLTASG